MSDEVKQFDVMGTAPIRRDNELFILKRKGIEFTLVSDEDLTSADNSSENFKGFLILTSQRIILLKNIEKNTLRQNYYEVPLITLKKEHLEHSIMNSKLFYRGKLIQIDDKEQRKPCERDFKIWFNQESSSQFEKSIQICLHVLGAESSDISQEELLIKINSLDYN